MHIVSRKIISALSAILGLISFIPSALGTYFTFALWRVAMHNPNTRMGHPDRHVFPIKFFSTLLVASISLIISSVRRYKEGKFSIVYFISLGVILGALLYFLFSLRIYHMTMQAPA